MRISRLAALALTLAACSDSTIPPDAAHISAVGDEVQSALPRDTLARVISVKVVDDKGEPQSGVEVTWTTGAPYGEAIPASSLTDRFGVARTKWVLGLGAGMQHLRASVLTYQESIDLPADAAPGFRAVKLMEGEPYQHMCALDADRQAWCWGNNDAGQLGSTAVAVGNSSEVPVPVAGNHRFITLIGGYNTSCGLDEAHHLWCWGSNQHGTFGNGATMSSPTPVQSASGLQLANMDLGTFSHLACGVSLDGVGYCWGDGVKGDGNGETQTSTPAEVLGGANWQVIGTADDYVCGMKLDHSAWCWGAHPASAGFTDDPVLTPTLMPDVPPLASLSAGWWNPCGMRADQTATAVCWGNSLYWQGSVGSTPLFTFNEPVRLVRSTSVTYIVETAEGTVKYLGHSPYWNDGRVFEPREIASDGPWVDVTTSEYAIYGIYQPDGVVYELRLTIPGADDSGWIIETHPVTVPAPTP